MMTRTNLFGEKYYKEKFDYNITHELTEINPEKISIDFVTMSEISYIQPKISKAIWRVAPGRNIGIVVKHKDVFIGAIALVSPVIILGVRDEYLGLSSDKSEKGSQLKNYADMSVCVGLQPLSWYWNIGKLIALLATSKEVKDFYYSKYGNELLGITTTSLYGKGCQYNRIYKFLGYTKGYGHEHITEEKYQDMIQYMRDNNIDVPSCRFGEGSNPRMRRISAYKKATGESFTFKHGKKRGVYYHPSTDKSITEISRDWYNRWGYSRYQRKKGDIPPYLDGKK